MTNIMMLHFSNLPFAAETAFLQSSSARTVAWILGLLVVLGTAWAASSIAESVRRNERKKQQNGPAKTRDVFEEICQAQDLSVDEKKQLLAFVDSSLLSKLAASDRDDAAEFRNLADRLFPPETSPSESDLAELTETPATV